MTTLALRALCLLLLSGVVLSHAEATESNHFTLYLVRHAEKRPDEGGDPHLTAEGMDRARRLARWLKSRDIEAVWSTDLNRTRETVKPLADALGRAVRIYDARDAAFPDRLIEGRLNAVVSGHSNTIPGLAAELCGCEVSLMGDDEYDRLLVLDVVEGRVNLTTLDQDAALPP